ncbi:MAG: agmatine deiminase family protein [Chitinophagaceae bacterium]|nr:agmatine deiminase family protein [Chitinophagaceae bacterium]
MRLPAEWEEQSFVQLTWPCEGMGWIGKGLDEVHECFESIIFEISKRQKVLIVGDNTRKIKEKLRFWNNNIYIVEIPANDIWARDHGIITVLEDNKPILLNFMFNGWGLKYVADKDNLINAELLSSGTFQDTPSINMDMVLEGGSIDVDGKGSLLTTKKCLLTPNRNPYLTQERITQKFVSYFGTTNVIWIENGFVEGDDTDGHIDNLVRFGPRNFLFYTKSEEKRSEHHKSLQRMEEEVKELKNMEKEYFRTIALPMPDKIMHEGKRLPATYTNFLILNDAVLVPFYSSEKDIIAAEKIQRVFNPRKVIGINCLPLIQQGGSLHCATMQFPVDVPLVAPQ